MAGVQLSDYHAEAVASISRRTREVKQEMQEMQEMLVYWLSTGSVKLLG
jgi:hypothetical protein